MFFLGHCCVVPWSKNGLGSGLFLLFVLALIETETFQERNLGTGTMGVHFCRKVFTIRPYVILMFLLQRASLLSELR